MTWSSGSFCVSEFPPGTGIINRGRDCLPFLSLTFFTTTPTLLLPVHLMTVGRAKDRQSQHVKIRVYQLPGNLMSLKKLSS